MNTYKKKHRGVFRRIGAFALALAVVLAIPLSAPAKAASEKEEVVYVKLNNDGSVAGIYVVNSFELGPDGKITDYGNYSYVKNLTNTDELKLENGVVTIDTAASRLYYEGVLPDAQLPWLFSIKYWLDGSEISPDELGGRSGSVRMEISSRENPDGNRELFEHFCLQISVSLSSNLCRNISAPSGTMAASGANKQITFMVFPGNEANLELTADVTDFEMPAITRAGVTMSMDLNFEDFDMSEMKELTDGLADLDDGVGELLDGVFDLRDGTKKFADGVIELSDGTSELADGTSDLKDGVGDLLDGTADMKDGAADLDDGVADLVDGVRDLDDGVGELSDGAGEFRDGVSDLLDGTNELYDGIVELADGARELSSGASSLAGGISSAASGGSELIAGYDQYFDGLIAMANAQLAGSGAPTLTKDNYEAVILEILCGPAIAQIKAGIQAQIFTPQVHDKVLAQVLAEMDKTVDDYNNTFTQEEKEAIDARVLAAQNQMVEDQFNQNFNLEEIKQAAIADPASAQLVGLLELLKGYDQLLSGLRAYVSGVRSIANGAGDLSYGADQLSGGLVKYRKGMKEYAEGVEELYDGAVELADGINELKDGTVKLLDGVVELKDGTAEFKDGVIELHDGVIDLFDGVVELHDGVIKLRDGVIDLKDGAIELRDGAGELYDGVVELKDGTAEIRENTANLDTDIVDGVKDAVSDMLGGDEPVSSFVSDKNGEIGSLQFVMQTEGISRPEVTSAAPAPEPELNIWQRFLKLFGINA